MGAFLAALATNLYDIVIGSIIFGGSITFGHKIGCKIGNKIVTKNN